MPICPSAFKVVFVAFLYSIWKCSPSRLSEVPTPLKCSAAHSPRVDGCTFVMLARACVLAGLGYGPALEFPPMKPLTSFLRRDVAAVQSWAETCGQIRPLLEEKDGAAAEVHHLQITNAKLHHH